MTKSTVMGSITFLVGFIEVMVALFLWILALPKMMEVYRAIDTYSVSYAHLIFGTIISLGLASTCFFISYKLFSSNEKNKERYLNYATGLILLSFVLVGMLTGLMLTTIILPIYSFTSTL